MWRGGKMKRADAYRWLRHSLSISAEEAHIGQFDEERCRLTIELIQKETGAKHE
jgi:hypothetical protein